MPKMLYPEHLRRNHSIVADADTADTDTADTADADAANAADIDTPVPGEASTSFVFTPPVLTESPEFTARFAPRT